MKLVLENIGMLERAEVKLDGLTVIAGENDTGKSTVGKALMAVNLAHNSTNSQSSNFHQDRNNAFHNLMGLIFDNQMATLFTNESKIILSNTTRTLYEVTMVNGTINYNHNSITQDHDRPCHDFIFIQTPFVWDLVDFFNSINYARSQVEIFKQNVNLSYPFLLWEIYGKLVKQRVFSQKKSSLNRVCKKNH